MRQNGTCIEEGCDRPRRYKGTRSGKRRYGVRCSRCHQDRYSAKGKLRMALGDECAVCGWAEARCDLHRVFPGREGGEYDLLNTVPLCPNCHRLAGEGTLSAEHLVDVLARLLITRVKAFYSKAEIKRFERGDTGDTSSVQVDTGDSEVD